MGRGFIDILAAIGTGDRVTFGSGIRTLDLEAGASTATRVQRHPPAQVQNRSAGAAWCVGTVTGFSRVSTYPITSRSSLSCCHLQYIYIYTYVHTYTRVESGGERERERGRESDRTSKWMDEQLHR